MNLLVEHDTKYAYAEPVRQSVQYLRLTPNQSPRQTVWRWTVSAPEPLTSFVDGFGNVVHVLALAQPVRSMTIAVRGHVTTSNGPAAYGDDALPPAVYLRPTALTTMDAALRDWCGGLSLGAGATKRTETLGAAIAERMTYLPGATDVTTAAADAFARGQGVCQDFVHIFLAMARTLGMPARYVSGYYRADVGGADYDANHAWAEVYLPDSGWMAIDVTNGNIVDERYVRLACGLDYLDAAPVRGMRRGGGTEDLQVRVRVSAAASGAQRQQQQQ